MALGTAPRLKAISRSYLLQDAAAIRGAIVAGELKAGERQFETDANLLVELLAVRRARTTPAATEPC